VKLLFNEHHVPTDSATKGDEASHSNNLAPNSEVFCRLIIYLMFYYI